MKTSRLFPKMCGFTLVEVVLAIGVIALAFIPVLGLLPVGLDVARQAIDTTVAAQIKQQMVNQAQQTDYSRLPELSGQVSYFDYQGNVSAPKNANYEASFTILSNTDLPAAGERAISDNLSKIVISILNRASDHKQGGQDLFKNPAATKIVVLITNNGR